MRSLLLILVHRNQALIIQVITDIIINILGRHFGAPKSLISGTSNKKSDNQMHSVNFNLGGHASKE